MSNKNFSVWDGSVASGFAGGTGTESNPYLIGEASQLAYLEKVINQNIHYSRNPYNAKYYRMICNIDLNKIEWTPIGTRNWISINFDGAGHIIRGLYINQPDNMFIGLFGNFTETSVFRNINVEDGYVYGLQCVGGIIGHIEDSPKTSIVENCKFSGEVHGDRRVGGVVGLGTGILKNCTNYGNIFGNSGNAGGVAGDFHGDRFEGICNITNCVNYGEVLCENNFAGGILGSTWPTSVIKYCTNYGNVTGKSAGGITCQVGNFEYCLNIGNITTLSNDPLNACVGGITSWLYGYMKSCHNSGTIRGHSSVGGLVGSGDLLEGTPGLIQFSTNTGDVYGIGNYVGGIAARLDGIAIENCKNEGKIEGGSRYTGGIVGHSTTDIKHCHNVGTVNGQDYGAGICGYNNKDDSQIINCVNDGAINLSRYGAGIAGYFTGVIDDCVNMGEVSLSNKSAGIVCLGGKAVKNCYNTGTINGSNQLGGIMSEPLHDNFILEKNFNSGKINSNNSSGAILGFLSKNAQITDCHYIQNSATKGIGSRLGSIPIESTGYIENIVTKDDPKNMLTLLRGAYMLLAAAVGVLFWSRKKEMLLMKMSKINAISKLLNISQNETPLEEATGNDMYRVIASTPLRKASDPNGEIASMRFCGDIVKVLPQSRSVPEGDYCKIEDGEAQVYIIPTEALQKVKQPHSKNRCYIVNAKHLGIHSYPDYESSEVAHLKNLDTVQTINSSAVIEELSTQKKTIKWIKIHYYDNGHKTGWVNMQYLDTLYDPNGKSLSFTVNELMYKNYNEHEQVRNMRNSNGLCIFAFEGLGSYSGEGNPKLMPNGRYGALMVVTIGNKVVYTTKNASTLPNLLRANIEIEGTDTKEYMGTAIIPDDVYKIVTLRHQNYYPAFGCRTKDGSRYLPCSRAHVSEQSRIKYDENSNDFFTKYAATEVNIHTAPTKTGDLYSTACHTISSQAYVPFLIASGCVDENDTMAWSLNGMEIESSLKFRGERAYPANGDPVGLRDKNGRLYSRDIEGMNMDVELFSELSDDAITETKKTRRKLGEKRGENTTTLDKSDYFWYMELLGGMFKDDNLTGYYVVDRSKMDDKYKELFYLKD